MHENYRSAVVQQDHQQNNQQVRPEKLDMALPRCCCQIMTVTTYIYTKINSSIDLFSSVHSFCHEFVNDCFPDAQSSIEKFGSILHERHYTIS